MSTTHLIHRNLYTLTFDEQPPHDGSTRLERILGNGFVEKVVVGARSSTWKAKVQTIPHNTKYFECPKHWKNMYLYACNIHDRTLDKRIVFAVHKNTQEVDDGKPSKDKDLTRNIHTALLCIEGITGKETYTKDGWIQPPNEKDIHECTRVWVIESF